MQSANDIRVALATKEDLLDLVDFLSQPEIDQAFVKPLSQRNISIKDRVAHTHEIGFWLLAKNDAQIVGCRGCKGIVVQEPRVVEFTTTAVDPAYRKLGIATLLVQTGIAFAYKRFAPQFMRFDSWATNAQVERMAIRAGFTKGRVYDDPAKRPVGKKSVEYIMDCSRFSVPKE